MSEYLNRVRQVVTTTGTGSTIILASTSDGDSFFTMTEAGAVDGHAYDYVLSDGNDVEIHREETWTASTRTFTRGTPSKSRIGGTSGTSKIDLSGSARLRIFQSAESMIDKFEFGSAAFEDSGEFATAEQGEKADSALQDASEFATAAQGEKADNAIQSIVEGTGVTVDATDPQNPIVSALGGGASNRLINPNGQIWQRANSGAAAITDGTYAFDRWYGLTQSAGVTASQVTNAENGTPYMMRLSQANATAQRMGLAQAIETANIIDARGQDVTLSARVAMSVSTTLRYAIIEWTGTADTITKDVVNSWTNTTFTPGNFFNSTSLTIAAMGSIALTANTLASIDPLTATISGSMNNVIVFFWTDSAQAQNVTMTIGKAQHEIGSSASPLASRSISDEINLCERTYEKTYDLATAPGTSSGNGRYGFLGSITWSINARYPARFKTRKRTVPTVTIYSLIGTSGNISNSSNSNISASAVNQGENGFEVQLSASSDSLFFHFAVDAEL